MTQWGSEKQFFKGFCRSCDAVDGLRELVSLRFWLSDVTKWTVRGSSKRALAVEAVTGSFSWILVVGCDVANCEREF